MTSTAERIARLPARPPLTLAEQFALDAWARVRLGAGQAEALRELQAARGLFGQLGVGEGKTAILMVAPELLQAQRPVAVIPGSLRDELDAEFDKYLAAGWRVRKPRVITYTELSQRYNDELLNKLNPDLLMLDEAWHARNPGAACTRKLDRWIMHPDNAQCVVVVLAGTLITADLLDFQHLAVWALKDRAPVPLLRSEAERWAETVTPQYFDHFRTRRGVVTTPSSSCPASLEISRWRPTLPEAVRRAIEDVEATGMRPDDEPLSDAQAVDCIQQLAGAGFYYVWDPLPPEDWLTARRAWHAYERAIRDEHLPGLDSTKQIEDALDDQPETVPYGDTGLELLHAWRAIEPTFEINRVPIWIDDSVLRQAVEFASAQPDPCLIWTGHPAAGRRLSELGVPYFGAGQPPPRDGKRTIAVSIDAHGKGRNLQAYRRGLVLTILANPEGWEQLIGRWHRRGQTADLVEVAIIDAIDYHRTTMSRVRYEARKDGRAADLEQKLIRATWKRA